MATVENECEPLMGDAEKSCGASDAAAGIFERFANEATFVTKHFRIEREAWLHHYVRPR